MTTHSKLAHGPKVVRRKRGEKLPMNTVYVGRPTAYGNPFVIGKDGDRARCVDRMCHADVLLEIANSEEWRADGGRT